MTTTRISKPFAIAAAIASFCAPAISLAPMAQADDALAPIRSTVARDRSGTACKALDYNVDLEATAQKYARTEKLEDGLASAFKGTVVPFKGSGDPQAAATTSAYASGAGPAISDCKWTDVGVGFVRYEEGQRPDLDGDEIDVVTIVFGQAQAPAPEPVKCEGGTTVPAGQTCPPLKLKVPVLTDAVDVTFPNKGALEWTVNVTNNSPDIGGKCTYNATSPGLPPSSKNFDLGPKGTATFQVPAPPLFTTWRVVTSCRGTWEGQDVEFGHDEQNVP